MGQMQLFWLFEIGRWVICQHVFSRRKSSDAYIIMVRLDCPFTASAGRKPLEVFLWFVLHCSFYRRMSYG